MVEGVSTIRGGKQRKVSSKGKRKKKGNSFHEHQLFSSAFNNLTFVYCFVSKNYCIFLNLIMFCEFILFWKLTFYDEYAFKGLYMYGVKCGTFSLLLWIFLFLNFFSSYEYVLKKLHVFFLCILWRFVFYKCVFSIIICVDVVQKCVNNAIFFVK